MSELEQIPQAILEIAATLRQLRTDIVMALQAQGRAGPMITAKEAAKRLGMHAQTLRRLAKQKVIPGHRVGRRLMFHTADVDHYLETLRKLS